MVRAVRFHQSLGLIPAAEQIELARAADRLGYAGVCIADHLFFPKELRSPYPYSRRDDGAPQWAPETEWPDPWCLISAMAAVTTTLLFTTNVYVAPARDLITVAKLAGSAAVLSGDRVRLGVGAGWCREEFDATGQPFAGRGRRLDDMIDGLRALWQPGWVEYHGTHYDVPAMQMSPAPVEPVPIFVGGHSDAAVRRAAERGDGWIGASSYREGQAWAQLDRVADARRRAGREDESFAIYLTLAVMPDVDLYRRFEDAGVSDLLIAPWVVPGMADPPGFDTPLATKVEASERFADQVLEPFSTQ